MRNALILAAVVLAGCTANVTTMKLTRNADGSFKIDSGKDIVFEDLQADAPDGSHIHVKGYSSNVNVNAIEAESAREAARMQGIMDAVSKGITLGVNAAMKGLAP